MTGFVPLNWRGILRLGLVQTALGAVVVMTTSTLNRVMVVELMLPAVLPGALVALHHAVQIARPRWGYGSDMGGRRTPWILGGMAVLALGGIMAAAATAWMATDTTAGVLLAVLAFLVIGGGVGAAGTSLLALLAAEVAPERRPAAATIVWLMMIAGFAITAGLAGSLLDPYSPERVLAVTAGVCVIAFLLAVIAVWGVERPRIAPPPAPADRPGFRVAMAEAWADAESRRFTIFVFISMLAYSAQDLLLEPFAGEVFGYSIGATTQLSGIQSGGVLFGMIIVAVAGRRLGREGALRAFIVSGCIGSAIALSLLVVAGTVGPGWPLAASYFVLGAANGAYAAAAIATMMVLAGGQAGREGTRMGLWGAAQAIAFGMGGFVGTVLADLGRWISGSAVFAYTWVFAIEAALFLIAAVLAFRLGRDAPAPRLIPQPHR